MTAIIGYEEPSTGDLWIAADGRAMQDLAIVSDSVCKLVHLQGADVIFGVAGTPSLQDLLAEKLDASSLDCDTPARLARCARKLAIEELHYKPDEDAGTSPILNFNLVIAWRGQGIFEVCGGGSATHIAAGRVSYRGSAGCPAGIALATLLDGRCITEELIRIAFSVAAKYDSSCGGETTIEVLRAQRGLTAVVS